jgi:sugar-specific transcriptional regulator TrmB
MTMDEIIDQLTILGLGTYEARAYAALLKRRHLSASELSKLGHIPNGRIYNILDGLVQKGFCLTAPGPVRKYGAVRPEVAVGQLMEEEKARLAKRQRNMAAVVVRLEEEFAKREDNISPLEFIQVLTAKSSQADRFHEMVISAKKDLRAFCKRPYAVGRTFDEPGKVTKPVDDALAAGIRTRGLWEIEEDNLENFITWVSHFEREGEEVRVIDHLPMKLLIVDDTAVMFTLQNSVARNECTSMVVHHSDITQALIALYEMFWEKATTLDAFLTDRKTRTPSHSSGSPPSRKA